jgi:hypothetical protein
MLFLSQFNRIVGLKNAAWLSWSALGYYRGFASYDCNIWEKRRIANFYSDTFKHGLYRFLWGFMGVYIYMNPFLVPVTFTKELYRLEANVRGLDEEIKSERYLSLL